MDERMSYLHQRDPSVDRRFRPRPRNQFNLINNISEDDAMGSATTDFGTTSSGSSTNSCDGDASVYLRLRPAMSTSNTYHTHGNNLIVNHGDEKKDAKNPNKDMTEKHFTFTHIFNDKANQAEIYNNCVYPYIQDSDPLTVLTYGTSGSGKTYTMHGTEHDCGLISRAIEQIFVQYGESIVKLPAFKMERGNVVLMNDHNFKQEEILREKYLKLSAGHEFGHQRQRIHDDHDNFSDTSVEGKENSLGQFFVVWVSFAEIYNEMVYDLLDLDVNARSSKLPMEKRKREQLKIICNDGNAFIKDLTRVHVRTAEEAMKIMNVGLKQAKTAFTNVNDRSSRSHCIFMIEVLGFRTATSEVDTMRYRFCDLAGSERLKKTGNEGARLREAQGINTSLSVLSRCLEATYRNQLVTSNKAREVVPYRESKLTTLLQAPLQGREKIVTIVNMCATDDFLEENMQVLSFAAMAQQIVQLPPPKPRRRSSLFRRPRSTRFSWIINTHRNNDSLEINTLMEQNIE